MGAASLDAALDGLAPWGGWDLGVDLDAVAAGDHVETMRYVEAALGDVWSALPADVRGAARQALAQLVELAIEMGEQALEEAVANLESQASTVPVVGLVVQIVALIPKLSRTVGDANRAVSNSNRAQARQLTLGAYSETAPAAWVYSARRMKGYARWVFGDRGTIRWAWCSPWEPDQGQAAIFGVSLPKPKGKWSPSNGVPLHCPTFQSGTGKWSGCSVRGATRAQRNSRAADRFEGRVLANALSWPYWCPSEPAIPMTIYRSEGGGTKLTGEFAAHESNPNAPLIERQALMLTDALSNLRVPINTVHLRHNAFLSWWDDQLSPQGLHQFVSPMDAAGNVVGAAAGRWTPDPQEDTDHKPQANARRFYIDKAGMVRRYSGYESEDLDLARFGLRPLSSGALGVSLAARNAVVSSTRAFSTARQSFLRDHRKMAALVADGHLDLVSPQLRAAVERSAQLFSRPKRQGPKRQPTIVIAGMRPGLSRPGGGSGAAAALLAAGAGLVFALSRR